MSDKYPLNGMFPPKKTGKPHIWIEARPRHANAFGKWQCTKVSSNYIGGGMSPIEAYKRFFQDEESDKL